MSKLSNISPEPILFMGLIVFLSISSSFSSEEIGMTIQVKKYNETTCVQFS